MRRTIVILLINASLLMGMDFTFGGGCSRSEVGSSKFGLGLSFGDYQSKYAEGLVLGWNVGISTIGSGEPDRLINEGVIIAVPTDRDWMVAAEFRPLYRFNRRNELFVGVGGIYNYINEDDISIGYSYSLGYQRMMDKYTFVGADIKGARMTYDSNDIETEHLSGKDYDLFIGTLYVGYRF